MHRTHARKARHPNRVIVAILALAAGGGWGAFAYTAHESSNAEGRLRGEIATLQDRHEQLRSEHEKVETSAATELTRLREQLATAKSELGRITDDYNRVQAELEEAQIRLKAAQALQERRGVAFIDVPPRPARQDVIAAQKALTELGYGKLDADGVVGPGTRQAIEAYQRDAGLTVTGDLHAETLQKLLSPSGRITAQSDD